MSWSGPVVAYPVLPVAFYPRYLSNPPLPPFVSDALPAHDTVQDVVGDGSIVMHSSSRALSSDTADARRPSIGDQVSFAFRRVVSQGAHDAGRVVEDSTRVRYLLGSGGVPRGVECALESMREGDSATFRVLIRHLPPFTTFHPEIVDICLEKIHGDIVLTPSFVPSPVPPGLALVKRRTRHGLAKRFGSVMNEDARKRDAHPLIRCDFGRVIGRVGCLVSVRFGLDADERGGLCALPQEIARAFPSRFVIGGGNVAEALDLACRLSSVGEVFELTFSPSTYGNCDSDETITDDETGIRVVSSRECVTILVTVTSMHVPSGADDATMMSPSTRVECARARKDRGTRHLKRGRIRAARRDYDETLRLLTLPFHRDATGAGTSAASIKEGKPVNITRGIQDEHPELMNATLLNAALVAARVHDWKSCEKNCNDVIDRRPGGDELCVKALFRRGRARARLNKWDDAEDDLKRALRLDPGLEKDVNFELDLVKMRRSKSDVTLSKAFKRAFARDGGCDDLSSRNIDDVENDGLHLQGRYDHLHEGLAQAEKGTTHEYTSRVTIKPGPGYRQWAGENSETFQQYLRDSEGVDGISDENDPIFIAERAVNVATQLEYARDTEHQRANIPFELYSEAERTPVRCLNDFSHTTRLLSRVLNYSRPLVCALIFASLVLIHTRPSGLPWCEDAAHFLVCNNSPHLRFLQVNEAFPMAKNNPIVKYDFACIDAEIAAEQAAEDAREKTLLAAKRGDAIRAVGTLAHPWDRDGSNAAREANEEMIRGINEDAIENVREEAATRAQVVESKRFMFTVDVVNVDE